ncbi:acyltransferase family protein [Streptomyces sp. NPDC091272]|uniref:acyltransferase family protein n=1 Tax=Streptomyces sp. NPDC091272 TaxID=3365981 RepID=UPI00382E7DA7
MVPNSTAATTATTTNNRRAATNPTAATTTENRRAATNPATTEKRTTARSAPAARRAVRLPSLTGLRFVAAALVLAFHASFEGFFQDRAAADHFAALFSKAGWVGVSFFFLLSGFVLAWSARRTDTARLFWRRRILKIGPSHLVTAAVAFLLLAAVNTVPGVGEVVPNLLLVHSWFPQLEIFISGNPVSWSLSCELFFYLAFPLLWRRVSRIDPARLWWWAGAVTVAVLCVPLVAGLLPAGPPVTMPDGSTGLWRYWFVYVLPPVRALEFVLGMLLARMVREGVWRSPHPALTAALAVAGYLLATQVPYLYGLVAATVVPLAVVTASVAHADATGRRTRLSGRTLVVLGETSFALYLVHRLVLMYGHRLLGATHSWSTPVAVLLVVASFVVSLLLARALYLLVERPLSDRWGSPAADAPRGAGARNHPDRTAAGHRGGAAVDLPRRSPSHAER